MPPIKDLLTNNTIRTYYALDEAMMTAHREDRDEFAIRTARDLLEHPDIPLLIRTRACIIIGCSEEPDFLDMAHEAVRIAKLGFDRSTQRGELEYSLVEAAEECLEGAQKAYDEMKAEEDGKKATDTPGDEGQKKQKSPGTEQARKKKS